MNAERADAEREIHLAELRERLWDSCLTVVIALLVMRLPPLSAGTAVMSAPLLFALCGAGRRWWRVRRRVRARRAGAP